MCDLDVRGVILVDNLIASCHAGLRLRLFPLSAVILAYLAGVALKLLPMFTIKI